VMMPKYRPPTGQVFPEIIRPPIGRARLADARTDPELIELTPEPTPVIVRVMTSLPTPRSRCLRPADRDFCALRLRAAPKRAPARVAEPSTSRATMIQL